MKEYEEALDVLKIAHSLAPDDMDIKALLDEVTINYRDEREYISKKDISCNVIR